MVRPDERRYSPAAKTAAGVLGAHGVNARVRRERVCRATAQRVGRPAVVRGDVSARAAGRRNPVGTRGGDDSGHDGGKFHLLPSHRAGAFPGGRADLHFLVFPRRVPGTAPGRAVDVRGVGVHGAGDGLQGTARRDLSAPRGGGARVASPDDATRVEKIALTGGAAGVPRAAGAVVRGGRGALPRVPARPVPQRTTRARPQPSLPARQRPRAVRGVLAGTPRVFPAVDVFHPGGVPHPPPGR